ncbi:MAG: hypothetical protein H6621_01155 [Halobacteriovoraceae bacterium]|nr:hypothetical protein [Halobacteriovoraceae bacterium]
MKNDLLLFGLTWVLIGGVNWATADTKSSVESYLKKNDFYSRSNVEYLLKGKVIANSDVDSPDKDTQTMWTKASAFHSRDCKPVLAKLSRYEDYSKYMSFIEYSTYVNGVINMRLKISLIPMAFDFTMKMPRIDKPGLYPFVFSAGILKGLTGTLDILEIDKRCFLFAKIDWKGKNLGYADFLMENFFTTVAKLGLEKVFSITGHRNQS